MRVANKILGPHLRTGHLHFRKPNEHSKCDTCIRLKRALRKKENKIDGSDSATRAYTSHILSQWLDRQIYWSFRSLSQSFFQQAAAGERLPDIALTQDFSFQWFVFVGQEVCVHGPSLALTCAGCCGWQLLQMHSAACLTVWTKRSSRYLV